MSYVGSIGPGVLIFSVHGARSSPTKTWLCWSTEMMYGIITKTDTGLMLVQSHCYIYYN